MDTRLEVIVHYEDGTKDKFFFTNNTSRKRFIRHLVPWDGKCLKLMDDYGNIYEFNREKEISYVV